MANGISLDPAVLRENIGPILGGLQQAQGQIAGAQQFGPTGAVAGLLSGQIGSDILRNLYRQQTPYGRAETGLLQQAQQPFQGSFEPIAERARSEFSTKTIPAIMERLTGMGGQRSSALRQSLEQAGTGLDERLAALRSQYGLQERGLEQQRMNALQNMLGQQRQLEEQQQQRYAGIGAQLPATQLQQQQQQLAAQLGLLGGLREQQLAQLPLGQLMALLQPAMGQAFTPVGHKAAPTVGQNILSALQGLGSGTVQAAQAAGNIMSGVGALRKGK